MHIVEAEVRVQLQCCIDDLASWASWHDCSATGYGQCLGESSQEVENGARVKGYRGSRQQRTEQAMIKFCRAIHTNWKV